MAYSVLTRLFDDKTWRLSRTAVWLIVGGFAMFGAIFCCGRAWNSYDRSIANDITTVIYAQFARNLLRYPLVETSGLMADLVDVPARTLIAGASKTFYQDHPPGFVWLVAAANRFLVADPVVAARLTSIIATIGTGMILLAFACRRVSPLPAIGAAVVLLTLRLFWEHAVVGNFEQVTAFFMVGAAAAFVGYLRRPTTARLAVTALLWVAGMLCDWPAYLLGAPFAAALLHRRQWRLLALFAGLGVVTMAAVFAHLLAGDTGMSVIGFFYDTFHRDQRHVPFLDTLAPIFVVLLHGFSWWALFLIVPLLSVFRRRAVDENARELRFVFLAFLFAGVANDLLFNQWAYSHSFWSYYLIPAACLGSAIAFQQLHELDFRSPVLAAVARTAAVALFVAGAHSTLRHMMGLKFHFQTPTTIAQMLDERGLADLHGRESVLLVPARCRGPLSTSGDGAGDPENAPRCDIYSGLGSLARYAFDRPAVPASDFDPAKTRCDRAFAVVKGPGMAARLARLSMPATEISWFDWHVLRLSKLAPGYCEDPARIFTDLSRSPAAASRPGN